LAAIAEGLSYRPPFRRSGNQKAPASLSPSTDKQFSYRGIVSESANATGHPLAGPGPARPQRWASGIALVGIWRQEAPRGLDGDLEQLPARVLDPFTPREPRPARRP